jgi:soluble lytic murein transglycosylase-like protein
MAKPHLRTLIQAFCLWLLFWQSAAHADVWGYVDEKGVAHFAAERLDERYELYFIGREGNGSGKKRTRKNIATAPKPTTMTTPPAKLLAFFDVSPNYKQVKHLLREASAEHQIDYELLQALIATESGFDADAVSPRGAVGLMQIMPVTARHYGVVPDRKKSVAKKLKDPRTNIRAGSLYLRDLMARFPGRLELSLAAYNAGSKAVRRAGNKVPRYKETQNFVKTVLQLYAVLKRPSMRPDARQISSPGRKDELAIPIRQDDVLPAAQASAKTEIN